MHTYVRLNSSQGPSFAVLEGSDYHVLSTAPYLGGTKTGEKLPSSTAKLLCPVTPTKILCVGRNYKAHANELGNEVPVEPLLFFKPPSSLIGPGDAIELPDSSVSNRIDHEVELALVIGKRTRNIEKARALDALFGVTIACDVTARDLQKKDGQWSRAKGMDTFCPCGPLIKTGVDASASTISCTVNGERKQHGNTRDMIFSFADVIHYASRFFTLEPGDVLLTGTPSGVGPLAPGDSVVLEVEHIGQLEIRVKAGGV